MSAQFAITTIKTPITSTNLQAIADDGFGNMVKGVVDLENKIIALGSELHADEEALLLEQGSKQQNLWGINLYPSKTDQEFLEFDSMINIRPGQKNMTRYVEDETIRHQITEIVNTLILKS